MDIIRQVRDEINRKTPERQNYQMEVSDSSIVFTNNEQETEIDRDAIEDIEIENDYRMLNHVDVVTHLLFMLSMTTVVFSYIITAAFKTQSLTVGGVLSVLPTSGFLYITGVYVLAAAVDIFLIMFYYNRVRGTILNELDPSIKIVHVITENGSDLRFAGVPDQHVSKIEDENIVSSIEL